VNTAAGIAERIRCSLQTPTIKLRLAEGEVSDAHHTSGLNCDFGPEGGDALYRTVLTRGNLNSGELLFHTRQQPINALVKSTIHFNDH
jgi:hypothetical protein